MKLSRIITAHYELVENNKEILSAGYFTDDYHDFKCTIRFRLPGLEIIEAKVQVSKVPMEICKLPFEKISELKGLKVERGFRPKVRRIIGGKNGCIHLIDLIHEMAQGIAALLRKARISPDGKEIKGFFSDTFYGECIGLNNT